MDATCYRIQAGPHTPSLRGAKRPSNPGRPRGDNLDCFASLAMTRGQQHRTNSRLRLLPRPQLLNEHPHILRIIDRDHDQMHAALLEGGIQGRAKAVDALDAM